MDKNKESNEQMIIPEAQQDLGVPEEQHFDKKTSLLKLSVGGLVSNLAIKEKWNKDAGRYDQPAPVYSIYFTESYKDEVGAMKTEYRMIPIPKNPQAFKLIGEHFLALSKLVEGLELEKASQVDDIAAAEAALARFKAPMK